MYGQHFIAPCTFERMSNMSDTPAERIAAFLKHTADEEGAISGYVRGGRAYALTREDLAALLAENGELRSRAKVAALRGQIASELDDIVEELKQRAEGSDDPTGRTILLVQADAVDAAAGRVRGQS